MQDTTTDPSIARHAGIAGVPIPDVGKPDPFSEAVDPRPVMTEKELSLNKAVAGQRAAAHAAEHPEDPVASAAIMDAASGPLKLAGLELQPITMGTLKVLREVGSSFVADDAKPLGEEEICAAILVFSDPKGAWRLLQEGRLDALKQQAEELAFELSIPDLRRAAAWINGQLHSLNQLAGDGEDHRPAPTGAGPGKPAASCG